MLHGDCNKCGLCCMEGGYRCKNLVVLGAIGNPDASFCAVYEARTNLMPIEFIDEQGERLEGNYSCYKGFGEDEIIIRKGIGKGCSLWVAEQPRS